MRKYYDSLVALVKNTVLWPNAWANRLIFQRYLPCLVRQTLGSAQVAAPNQQSFGRL